jgi:hypothetical protein
VDIGAAGGRSSGEPGAAVHGRSTVDRGSGGPRPRGPSLWGFLYEINSLNQYFQEFCKEAPVFLCNEPAVQEFTVRPGNLKNNSKKVPSLEKIHKNSSKTSKIHIVSSTTPKPVILVPKFSESLPLSFYAFI